MVHVKTTCVAAPEFCGAIRKLPGRDRHFELME